LSFLTTVFLLWVLPVSGDYDISFGFGNIFHENNSAFTQSPGVGENKNFPHYSIKAIYSGKKIYGEEEVLYTNTTGRTLKYIFFVLPASAVTPGAEIKIYSVSVNDQPVEWEAKNTYLVVYLPFYLSPLEKCRVSISFDTIVPESPTGWGSGTEPQCLPAGIPPSPLIGM